MHHDVKKKKTASRNKMGRGWMRLSEQTWMLLKSQAGQPASPMRSV